MSGRRKVGVAEARRIVAKQLREISFGRSPSVWLHCADCPCRMALTHAYRCLICGCWRCKKCMLKHVGEAVRCHT